LIRKIRQKKNAFLFHFVNLNKNFSRKTFTMKTIVSPHNCCIQGDYCAKREMSKCVLHRGRTPRRREYHRSSTTTSERPSSSSSYFWRSPVGPDHHTPWWGWLYRRGPPPAPFMGASRRVVTLPNFTWSNDTEQISFGITSFPRACMHAFSHEIPALGTVALNIRYKRYKRLLIELYDTVS